MRLPELTEKIKQFAEYPDLPKDVFVFLLIVLVGVGGYLLGRISTGEKQRLADLKLLQIGEYTDPAENGRGSLVATLPTEHTQVSTSSAPKEEAPSDMGKTSTANALPQPKGSYVASKNGEAYYLPWCSGVKLIREENKIWFASKEEAQAKGYRPAANCKGI